MIRVTKSTLAYGGERVHPPIAHTIIPTIHVGVATRDSRETYYRTIAQQRPKLNKFLQGWLNRLDAVRSPVFMPPQPTCLYLSCADGCVRLDAHVGCGDSFPPTDVHTWTRECSWPHSHRGHARFHKPHKSILLQRAVLDPAGRCAPRIANMLVS